jgi:hypothetical protein
MGDSYFEVSGGRPTRVGFPLSIFELTPDFDRLVSFLFSISDLADEYTCFVGILKIEIFESLFRPSLMVGFPKDLAPLLQSTSDQVSLFFRVIKKHQIILIILIQKNHVTQTNLRRL